MAVVQWLAPAPLWDVPAIRQDRDRLRRPTLLRLTGDDFMERLQALLASRPAGLRDLVARAETWRAPVVGLDAPATASPEIPTLYQPVHDRFYLLAASLACRVPGFPDHGVHRERDERLTFVLRRFEPAQGGTPAREYAWIEGASRGWSAATPGALASAEQELALFPLTAGAGTTMRRVYAGLIPVGQRETYVAGRTVAPAGAPEDLRLVEFQRAVIDPWADLLDWYDRLLQASPTSQDEASAEFGGALILADCADFLARQVPALWSAVAASARPGAGPLRDLYDALTVGVIDFRTSGMITLQSALLQCLAARAELESASFAGSATPAEPADVPRIRLYRSGARSLMDTMVNQQRRLVALLTAALPATPAAPIAARPPARAPDAPAGGLFVARCVYHRPQCRTVVLSDATDPFRLGSFFDPDAPARPVQVALPLDTTPAALRRYDKNVAFLISDELAKQMGRLRGLEKLTKGEVGDAAGLGMICSLSIPIITLCAFVVLMIFIALLNIVFWWMPFFKICFPVPGLKGKG